MLYRERFSGLHVVKSVTYSNKYGTRTSVALVARKVAVLPYFTLPLCCCSSKQSMQEFLAARLARLYTYIHNVDASPFESNCGRLIRVILIISLYTLIIQALI